MFEFMLELVFELPIFALEYGVAVEIGLAVGELIDEFEELELRRFPFPLPLASEQADAAINALNPAVIISSLLMCSPVK